MSSAWRSRIDPLYLPGEDVPAMGLGPATLGPIRASLAERRAASAVATSIDHVAVRDVAFAVGGRSVSVRLYRPTATGPLPVLVYAHAGAYVLGNLDTDHRRCLDLAALAGCVVASVDYRLAPEHPHPAALDDCFGVLAAVLTDPAAVGGDGTRVAVGGSSAGAGLAAALAVRARDELPRGAVRFQLLHQPMLDDACATPSMQEFADTPYFDAESARFAWSAYRGDRPSAPYLAAARIEDLAGLPPAHVACSEVDPLRDEAVEHAVRLLRAGVSTELHVHPATCHGFDSVAPETPLSRAVLREQAAALKRALA